MKKNSFNLTLILLVIFFVGFVFLILQFSFLFTPMIAAGGTALDVEIPPGTPMIALAWQLKRYGLLKNPNYFVLLARARGDLGKIKAGEYAVKPGITSPSKFLNNVVAGKILLRPLTIIEGWTFQQTMQAINSNPYLTHTLAGLDNASIMAKLGYAGINPEGQFYPDTYLFGRGTTDTRILTKAHNAMNRILTAQWNNRAPDLPYLSSYDALTAASLIERETAIPQERPMIAGVIIRRLQLHMRLQIDPTVIYALGDNYVGKLTAQDMGVASPYNTYRHNGLPPSPIGMPSKASINASLHPTAGDALYYVANGNGRHIFSTTLRQHNAAINQYLAGPRFCLSAKLLLNNLQMNNFQTTNYEFTPMQHGS